MLPQIVSGKPALVLAPMEGVTDAPMRALMTERGGFSFCVSEFLRVCGDTLPDHVFYTHVPELRDGCRTHVGTPIQVQILGGDELIVARTAAQVVRLGAQAVDLNFGCPSKTVNRHDGGATLLQYPHRIRAIVKAARDAVPAEIPVSAKLRLGWEKMEDVYENAIQACAGGATWLTIHARTKKQGYAPPAYWKYLGEVRQLVSIPVVANGEIWSLDDFRLCREQTGCEHFMIGRGALADPSLPLKISRELGITASPANSEFRHSRFEWEPLLQRFSELNLPFAKKGETAVVGRLKQWLKFAQVKHQMPWFDQVKHTQTLQDLFSVLRQDEIRAVPRSTEVVPTLPV